MRSKRVREELLRLLREDVEFRHAALGLLGMEEVLKGISKNTEAIKELQAQVAKHSELIKAHSEAIRGMQEQVARYGEAIKEHSEAIKEHSGAIRSVQEQVARFGEVVKEHSAAIKSLQEQVALSTAAIKSLQEQVSAHSEVIKEHSAAIREHSEAIRKLGTSVQAIGTRYGVFAEEAFRESVKYLIEDVLKAYTAQRWVHFDEEGEVYGHPSVVEVDVLVKDEERVLVEYKASLDKPDVSELYRIGRLYERVTKAKPKLLIVSPSVRKRARELAAKLGIELRGVMFEE